MLTGSGITIILLPRSSLCRIRNRDPVWGFYAIEAKSYDDAVSIASTCPHVKYSARIEVREVDF